MNYLQTELILLNLLRQSEEFVVSLLGLMPEPDAGSFYKRLSTLYEIFKTDKTGFAASSFRLGQVALFLKEYAALTKQNIDQVDIPEILSPAISWEDIEDKPEFFAPYSHFHKWEEIANKPVKYLPVTHQHIWNDVTDKPTTFPPVEHTHEAQAVAWTDVTDKPTTFSPRMAYITFIGNGITGRVLSHTGDFAGACVVCSQGGVCYVQPTGGGFIDCTLNNITITNAALNTLGKTYYLVALG